MRVSRDAREPGGAISEISMPLVANPDTSGAMAQTVVAETQAGGHRVSAIRGASRRRLSTSFLVEVSLAMLVGLLVVVMQPGFLAAGGGLVVWALVTYQHGATVRSPVRPQVRPLLRGVVAALGLVSMGVALGLLGPDSLFRALPAVTAAALVAGAVRLLDRSRSGPVRTLVIGDSAGVMSQTAQWSNHGRIEVVATCVIEPDLDANDYPTGMSGIPALRTLDDVAATARRMNVEAVMVVPGLGFTAADLQRLSWSLEHLRTPVGVVGILDKVAPHRLTPSSFGDRQIVHVSPSRQPLWLRMCKFTADRVAGLALLVISAPVIAVLCAVIRLDSPGPAIFRQKRIGLDGRPFTMYKLRTMQQGVPKPQIPDQRTAGNQMLFKMKEDPRVTRIGGFLRRTSLDELPQLINVVRGEMSLIGPRPALPEEVSRYDTQAYRRTVVRPGMTGLWQVSGRSDLSWDDSLALDLKYVDNWRLTDDAVILARTVKAVLRSRGAY